MSGRWMIDAGGIVRWRGDMETVVQNVPSRTAREESIPAMDEEKAWRESCDC